MPLKFLVVEPQAGIRTRIASALSGVQAGCEIAEAEDGRAALRSLSSQRVHALVSAWRMPVLGGEGLLNALRRNAVLSRKPMLIYGASSPYTSDAFALFTDRLPEGAALISLLRSFVELKVQAPAPAPAATATRKIIFLCVNAEARGPMAEGLAQQLLGPEFIVASAGFRGNGVNPLAVKVMGEIGIDISALPSRALRNVDATGTELAINLCFNEMAPILTGRLKRYDWPLPDPSKGGGGEEEQLARFRAARDNLSKRIQQLAKEIRQPEMAGYGL